MKTLLHFTESIDPKEILPQSFLATLSPRVKWEMVAGTKYQILENRYHVSCYRGGQWKTLQSALHRVEVPSFAIVNRKGDCKCVIGAFTFNWNATPEYAFRIDQNGVALYLVNSPKDDYHFSANEALNIRLEGILKMANLNREKRLSLEAQKVALEAEAQGVYVCLADSLKAGNCLTGSLQWALQNGLDPKKHYPARELLSKVSTDFGRLRLTITAAILRTKKELEQGFALLSEHQV